MKSEIYESLSVINQATEQMVRHVRRLRDLAILTPGFAEVRRLTAEQLRAQINHKVIITMEEAETQSASLLSKLKEAEEKKLAGEEEG